METRTNVSQPFLTEALRYLQADFFNEKQTSRTIKPTNLSEADITQAIDAGKFERSDLPITNATLPPGYHGVNVFTTPELKGRRRIITEPALNRTIEKDTLPRCTHLTRLGRRQRLRECKYMIQIDFDAFYDTIPIPPETRRLFTFRTKTGYYHLKTIPTGARWSVAVGQAITSVIVDIDTPAFIDTMIDNIMIAARDGEEKEFLTAIRHILQRIGLANLKTTPPRPDLEHMTDRELLALAKQPNTFIGEEFTWEESRRVVRNTWKTVAKITLAIQKERHTYRSFASLISLISYAHHTTGWNPAILYPLKQEYSALFRAVVNDQIWDNPLPPISEETNALIQKVGQDIVRNERQEILPYRPVPMTNEEYDIILITDASRQGWGAIAQQTSTGTTMRFQERWIHELYQVEEMKQLENVAKRYFLARHSAHAEPRAVSRALDYLLHIGWITDNTSVAVMSDHEAITVAQRKANGFGGIGRGYSLNKLYEKVYDWEYKNNVLTRFYYIPGPFNPADSISRNFGEYKRGIVELERKPGTTGLPRVNETAIANSSRKQ